MNVLIYDKQKTFQWIIKYNRHTPVLKMLHFKTVYTNIRHDTEQHTQPLPTTVVCTLKITVHQTASWLCKNNNNPDSPDPWLKTGSHLQEKAGNSRAVLTKLFAESMQKWQRLLFPWKCCFCHFDAYLSSGMGLRIKVYVRESYIFKPLVIVLISWCIFSVASKLSQVVSHSITEKRELH